MKQIWAHHVCIIIWGVWNGRALPRRKLLNAQPHKLAAYVLRITETKKLFYKSCIVPLRHNLTLPSGTDTQYEGVISTGVRKLFIENWVDVGFTRSISCSLFPLFSPVKEQARGKGLFWSLIIICSKCFDRQRKALFHLYVRVAIASIAEIWMENQCCKSAIWFPFLPKKTGFYILGKKPYIVWKSYHCIAPEGALN